MAIIILIGWIPILCMLFQGTFIKDTWGQLQLVMKLKNGIWSISAHHPVFDTFVMSLVILPIVIGCWMAPVSVHLEGKQYLYPVVYSIPFSLMWCIYSCRNIENEKIIYRKE